MVPFLNENTATDMDNPPFKEGDLLKPRRGEFYYVGDEKPPWTVKRIYWLQSEWCIEFEDDPEDPGYCNILKLEKAFETVTIDGEDYI